MPRIVADVNIEGQVQLIIQVLKSPLWNELWTMLNCELLEFSDLGLLHSAPDDVVWETIQKEGVFLITDNRNEKGADSLEATIKRSGTLRSLPVITIGNVGKIARDPDYRGRAAEKLMEYLMDPDAIRGTGRVYIP